MPERQRRNNKPVATLTERPIATRHIQILLDRSGSMESIKGPMEEGYGTFLREQRAIPGAADIKFVLTQFDSQGVDDVDVGTLFTAKALSLQPRGGTPLYRSLIRTIEKAAQRMGKDDVMLFVTITDGQNNEGEESLPQARDLIAKKMDEGWAFIYLGANQDSWEVGRDMGYLRDQTMDFAANSAGSAGMYASASATASAYRTSRSRSQIKALKIEPKIEPK